jgi:hypothetical protein
MRGKLRKVDSYTCPTQPSVTAWGTELSENANEKRVGVQQTIHCMLSFWLSNIALMCDLLAASNPVVQSAGNASEISLSLK